MTKRLIALAIAAAFSLPAAAEQSVEVLHWWTSGGEAAALNVLKGNLEKQGVKWNDMPVAGGGGEAAMTAVRARVGLPLLRKDFIVEEYQLFEARAAGADAVLLIVAALEQQDLVALQARAWELGLATLVEVHDEAELARAIDSGARVIGVNNRNLRTLRVDVEASGRLASRMPRGAIGVSESGLKSREELDRLAAAGYRAFLIGERFMVEDDPGAALGTIEPGKLADLIVVAADPLQDITNLRTLRLVFKEGRLVADHRAGARQVD